MRTLLLTLFLCSSSFAALVGKKAPNFKLKNEQGRDVSLDQFKGQYIVLEWLNHGCPFIKKHYGSNNMQKVQEQVLKKKAVWLSVISSAEGRQGYSTPEQALKDKKQFNSNATAILLDPKGEVGKLYEAKTTPHMFIINKAGLVVYEGAIDSIASSDSDDIKKADNYILKAFDDISKGRAIKTEKSAPYGCSVKY